MVSTQLEPTFRLADRGSASAAGDSWSLIVAVNNEGVFRGTLLASPAIDSKCQVIAKRGFTSAGLAYNAALAEAENEIVVFAHQDVYLPKNWKRNLEYALGQLATMDPTWGVAGVFGVTRSNVPEHKGHCYSTGLGAVLGQSLSAPIEAQSLDELVLVVRRSSGLSFDDELPGFHLYGTDICLQSATKGMGNYIIPAFCVHNSNGVKYYPVDFWRAYFYLRRKWWPRLPVTTCCTKITKSCLPVLKSMFRDCVDTVFRLRSVGSRVDDVATLYRSLSLNP
jgi:Glycosyltransferase like family